MTKIWVLCGLPINHISQGKTEAVRLRPRRGSFFEAEASQWNTEAAGMRPRHQHFLHRGSVEARHHCKVVCETVNVGCLVTNYYPRWWQLRGMVFTGICMIICLYAQCLKNRCNSDQQTGCRNIFHDESWKPIYFVFKRSKVMSHKQTLSAWVFALLWVLATSSYYYKTVPLRRHRESQGDYLHVARIKMC